MFNAFQPAALGRWICTMLACAAMCAQAQTVPGKAKEPGTSKPKVATKAKGANANDGTPQVAIEPTPSWVVAASAPGNAKLPRAPMHYKLIERQVRLEAASESNYSHIIRVVNETTGLANAAQIEIAFDPSYQALSFHHLDVIRNGQRINKLDRKRFQLLRRETQLERQMIDGRFSLSIVLDDLRVGDEIDYDFSVRGSNPVFGDKFSHVEWMASDSGPVALYQVRLLAPPQRKVLHRMDGAGLNVSTRELGAFTETVYRREAVPMMHMAPQAPMWAAVPFWLQLTEFDGWPAVAAWGQSLFKPAAASPLVDKKAAEIAAASSDPITRLQLALNFVQKDIRYFGTEIGANSHLPAPPETILTQRFGDCKDKVNLLVALLTRLDIPAEPVLVSSYLNGHVEQLLPSPLAFNHVIAHAKVGEQDFWLDATRSEQTGPAAKRQSTGFVKGLHLLPGAQGLAALPKPFDEERMKVKDTFRFKGLAEDPVLESRITYRGELAEGMRMAIAAKGIDAVATDLSAAYAKLFPKLEGLGTLDREDADNDNALTLVRRYSVPDFWRYPEQTLLLGEVYHWAIVEALAVPKTDARTDAFAFTYPGIVRQDIVVDFGEKVFTRDSNNHVEESDAHFQFRSSVDGTRDRITSSSQVRISSDEVKPKDWSSYIAKLNKVAQKASQRVGVSAMTTAEADRYEAQVQDLRDAVKNGTIKAKTVVQVKSRARNLMLSAQIRSGRLPKALLADALTHRAENYDHIDQLTLAEQDLTRARELNPEAVDTLNASSVNAVMRGDFTGAVRFGEQSLAKSPQDLDAPRQIAMAQYFLGQHDAAAKHLHRLMEESSQVRSGYAVLWLWLNGLAAKQPAAEIDAIAPEQLPTEWPRPLIDLARGQTTEKAVIEKAKASKDTGEQLTEAYFYLAEKALAEGNKAQAKKYWQSALDLGVVEFVEYGLARLRLKDSAL